MVAVLADLRMEEGIGHFKDLRRFERVVKPYGLTLRVESHVKILHKGRVVYSMSLSPHGGRECENSIADLVKMGYLPKELKKIRIR